MTYRFETVWTACTPALSEEIIAFWTGENALPAGENALDRSKQTVIVTRDGDGRIVGTATAYLRTVPRLGQPMYYYRMYCNANHRGQRTGFEMLQLSQSVLCDYSKSKDASNAIGIILEVENTMYTGRYPQAAWPLGFNFIGYSPRRLPLYAYYFPEAKLLPPIG
jgi:hypothetical protein